MKKEENEKWLDKVISGAIRSGKPEFDAEKWKQEYPEEFQELKSRAKQSTSYRQASLFRIVLKSRISKLAAAAMLLIVVGYAIGLLTAPRQLNAEQLHALEASLKSSLEPAIRRDITAELNNQWALALAKSHFQLKDELNQQFRRDLNQYAVWTLAASNTVTNQLLTELIQSINAAQTQDRRWIEAALEQIELNRLQDKVQLTNGLETLALYTDDELMRTKQDVAGWIAYGQPDSFVPKESKSINNSNERSKK